LIIGWKYNEKVDIYSLVIVFWEYQTKKFPFEDSGVFQSVLEKEIIQNHLRSTISAEEWEDTAAFLQLSQSCWQPVNTLRSTAIDIAESLKKLRLGQKLDVSKISRVIESLYEEDNTSSSFLHTMKNSGGPRQRMKSMVLGRKDSIEDIILKQKSELISNAQFGKETLLFRRYLQNV
jgi:hypothetical protein